MARTGTLSLRFTSVSVIGTGWIVKDHYFILQLSVASSCLFVYRFSAAYRGSGLAVGSDKVLASDKMATLF